MTDKFSQGEIELYATAWAGQIGQAINVLERLSAATGVEQFRMSVEHLREAKRALGELANNPVAATSEPTPSEEVEALDDEEKVRLANMLIVVKGDMPLTCEYKNWRGEVAVRRLRPISFWYGSTEWHPTPGLMLKAFDLDKNEERDFCVADFNTSTLRPV
ncbi:hypothetical protein O9X98_08860 [Agrobacterium salinitolerans]|nr:hypothetical protein [Agrobacterium salinitolerans]